MAISSVGSSRSVSYVAPQSTDAKADKKSAASQPSDVFEDSCTTPDKHGEYKCVQGNGSNGDSYSNIFGVS